MATGQLAIKSMSLKRPQHSMEEFEIRSFSPFAIKNPTDRRTFHSSKSLTTSSIYSSKTSLPLASAPRTVEIMWGGYTTPGFTLKRKRTGAILVSTVTHETQVATTLKVGSELKLVGGFPVNRLTLQDIKKVMLMAPKPVSLVFVNVDDVVISNVGDMTEFSTERNVFEAFSTANRPLMPRANLQCSEDSGENSDSIKSSTSTFYSEMSLNNQSKKRKVSKLQVALVRVNQLLNRPVRQAGLHIAVGKSIVV